MIDGVELDESNSAETTSGSSDSETSPAFGSQRARFELTQRRFVFAWASLAFCESLFLSLAVFFVVANLFPVDYFVIALGLVVSVSPLIVMQLCTLPRKGMPFYGTRPCGSITQPDLRREQTCRWLVTRIGAVIVPINLALVVFVIVLWWAPYTTTGLANLPTLCVAGLGFVGTTTARVVVRCPIASRVRVLAWPHDGGVTGAAAVFSDWADLSPETVSSAVCVISDLTPATAYRWVVEYDSDESLTPASGSLRTQPLVGTPAAAKFRFTFGSCLLRDSLSPFDSLAEIARANSSFMVFLGDVIYIDQPNPEIVGPWRFAYEAKYVSNFDDVHMRAIRLNLPWIVMYDDHEVRNDWDGGEDDLFDVAIHDVWWNLLGQGNPPSMRAPSTVKGVLRPSFYHAFRHGDACFIMLDVRRHRSRDNAPNDASKTMLGATQLADLLSWLVESNKPSARCVVKFVCTPVPMTATALSGDTWSAFDSERQLILDFVVNNNITGVVFLSGDRHTGAVIQLQGSMVEASASPMDGFWSVDPAFTVKRQNETVLSEQTSRDFWGTVDVDTSDEMVGRVTLSIDGQGGVRAFTKTIEIPKV